MDKADLSKANTKEPLIISEWQLEMVYSYRLTPAQMSIEEQQSIIKLAILIIQNNFKRWEKLESASDVQEHLKILLADEKEEVFCMIFLDSQHRILSFDTLFRGSVHQANVYPRVVVRRALEVNAAAGIMVHNHPSGWGKPSDADKQPEKMVPGPDAKQRRM